MQLKNLIPLGDYTPPSRPTEESIRRLAKRFENWMNPKPDDPFMTADELERADSQLLSELAGPPSCGPAIDMIEFGLSDWLRDQKPARLVQFLVLPGGENSSLVQSWAERGGHTVVSPPSFDHLLETDAAISPCNMDSLFDCKKDSGTPNEQKGLGSQPVFVIPQLERWFVRHHFGLSAIRQLLDRLAGLERHCVVGCNSWAWKYLSQVIGSATILSSPLTIAPFTAAHLRDWFSELAELHEEDTSRFLRASDGKPVLEKADSGALTSDYLLSLAAHSLGIPWIAWHFWRASLRTSRSGDTSSNANKSSKPNTQPTAKLAAHASESGGNMWLSEYHPPQWPADCVSESLLILHAILLHGSLTEKQLLRVLPSIDFSNVLASLESRKFVRRRGQQLSCQPLAYPTIRNRLLSAGIACDAI